MKDMSVRLYSARVGLLQLTVQPIHFCGKGRGGKTEIFLRQGDADLCLVALKLYLCVFRQQRCFGKVRPPHFEFTGGHIDVLMAAQPEETQEKEQALASGGFAQQENFGGGVRQPSLDNVGFGGCHFLRGGLGGGEVVPVDKFCGFGLCDTFGQKGPLWIKQLKLK